MIGNTPSGEIMSAPAFAVYAQVKTLIDAGTAFTVTIDAGAAPGHQVETPSKTEQCSLKFGMFDHV